MSSIATILGILIVVAICGMVLAQAARRRQRRPQGQPDEPQASPVSFDVQLTETGHADPQLVLSCPFCDFEAPLEDPAMVGQSVVCPICDQSFEVLKPDPATAST
ncbi:MAG: hypothetical protein O7D91_14860 [Planctomycetota bacterium]|nr:hypothetical protein [Planctomycetota bacterium]